MRGRSALRAAMCARIVQTTKATAVLARLRARCAPRDRRPYRLRARPSGPPVLSAQKVVRVTAVAKLLPVWRASTVRPGWPFVLRVGTTTSIRALVSTNARCARLARPRPAVRQQHTQRAPLALLDRRVTAPVRLRPVPLASTAQREAVCARTAATTRSIQKKEPRRAKRVRRDPKRPEVPPRPASHAALATREVPAMDQARLQLARQANTVRLGRRPASCAGTIRSSAALVPGRVRCAQQDQTRPVRLRRRASPVHSARWVSRVQGPACSVPARRGSIVRRGAAHRAPSVARTMNTVGPLRRSVLRAQLDRRRVEARPRLVLRAPCVLQAIHVRARACRRLVLLGRSVLLVVQSAPSAEQTICLPVSAQRLAMYVPRGQQRQEARRTPVLAARRV